MAVRLRYLSHELEVPLGQFVIGRSADCQLALDDPLVSRRHALLTVRTDNVTVEDLGSRNGVRVNDKKIEGRVEVTHGDKITIGSQEMTVEGAPDESVLAVPESIAFGVTRATTLTPHVAAMMQREDLHEEPWTESTTPGISLSFPTSRNPPVGVQQPDRRVTALSFIGSLADKALTMGRAEEAERILNRSLNELLERARDGSLPPNEVAAKAAMYAAKLATATSKGSWIEYIFALYSCTGQLVPGSVVDELYSSVRKVKSLDMTILRNYIESLRKRSAQLGPSERFVQQRLEGLERLGGLK
ncbi:MAG TPA: FHA domain-containing protein [Polyangium sp.]|jgi:predicted component of type VI protein secretion system|nr:FHA domain-containing protein [Polyangium sp.]